ncbi:MAG: hypothetical protein AB8B56_05810 [Crocinitomicaceae bacterium]
MNFVLAQFNDLDVTITSTELLNDRESFFTFIAVIALLPILFLFAHFVLKDQKPSVFLFIIPITLICGVAMMAYHIYSLRYEIQEMQQFETTYLVIKNTVSLEKIHAARFLGIGFLIGAISTTAVLSFLSRDSQS